MTTVDKAREALLNSSDASEAMVDALIAAVRAESQGQPDYLDGAREEYIECREVRRLLGYLWLAHGINDIGPVRDMFTNDDPLVGDVERLAIFPEDAS